MRKFLYITPYFPPQSRVGALRPLKFARHLPACGWSPVVLCDLWPSAGINLELLSKVPPNTAVLRRYSRRAEAAEQQMHQAMTPVSRHRNPGSAHLKRLSALVPKWLNNPELIPLGEHSVHIPHAIAAAEQALKAHPECEAILVNADPYAALLVGAAVARRSGLPLVQDLRDPWSVCELRRPRRPALIRRFVDRLERYAFDAASKVVLNTETALRDTVAHYEGVLPAARFTSIRNHGDRALIGSGEHPGFDRFTMLFLGNFRRFLEGDVLLKVLKSLKERGVNASQLQLVVTGSLPESARQKATELGVDELLVGHPFAAYTEIGPVMRAADVLVALSNRSTQRVPAKFYDYILAERPILAISENPEFGGLVQAAGGEMFGMDEPERIADALQTLMRKGRLQTVARSTSALSSEEASAHMASVLNEVTSAKG